MVPVLGVDPGRYDLAVHAHEDEPFAGPPTVRSGGWVLETATGHLLLGPMACLVAWDPDDLRYAWVRVPPGCYAVELRGYPPRPDQAPSDGSYGWALRRTPARPWFTADVGGAGPGGA